MMQSITRRISNSC